MQSNAEFLFQSELVTASWLQRVAVGGVSVFVPLISKLKLTYVVSNEKRLQINKSCKILTCQLEKHHETQVNMQYKSALGQNHFRKFGDLHLRAGN